MTPVRIAVVGAGLIGIRHLEILAEEPMCEVAAVVDPAETARDFAAKRGLRWFDDPVPMLDTVKPDGVIVATPNILHAPMGHACIERGIPTLIEKPLADTVEAAFDLALAAERNGVALLVGHFRRHSPIIQKAREIVQSGRLGRLTSVAATCLFYKPDSYYDMAWRTQRGGGPVLINAVHDIDALRFICGDILSVQALASNVVRRFEVEDTVVAILEFKNGALGTITLSDTAVSPWSWELTAGENPSYPRQLEHCYLICGTEGSFSIPRLEWWHYSGERNWWNPLSRETIEIERADPLVRQTRHFCRVIRGEEAPLINGRDAAQTLATTLAIVRSAETASRIVLE